VNSLQYLEKDQGILYLWIIKNNGKEYYTYSLYKNLNLLRSVQFAKRIAKVFGGTWNTPDHLFMLCSGEEIIANQPHINLYAITQLPFDPNPKPLISKCDRSSPGLDPGR
jgi:hypothetical protein